MPRFQPPLSLSARGVRAPTQPPAQAAWSIGDVARDFGVTLRTLRFYEAKGMLTPTRRGATRLYAEKDRAQLATILKAKDLGFTLREIRALVADGKTLGEPTSLALSPDKVAEQIAHLESQKAEIERALARLRGIAQSDEPTE